jgi:hypothetical protein
MVMGWAYKPKDIRGHLVQFSWLNMILDKTWFRGTPHTKT